MATIINTRTVSLDALVDLYRYHAALQRRMVNRRNRQQVATGKAARWSERSLDCWMAHSDMIDAVRERLIETGYAHLALSLQHEATALSQHAWRHISGETEPPAIGDRLTRAREVIAAIRSGMVPSWKCADRFAHCAHVWTGPAAKQWLCKGIVR